MKLKRKMFLLPVLVKSVVMMMVKINQRMQSVRTFIAKSAVTNSFNHEICMRR